MDFKWINEGQVKTDGNRIEIFAPAQSDFFFNNGTIGEEGITPKSLCNAPFYYKEKCAPLSSLRARTFAVRRRKPS